jgi:hypothetical protein
MLARSFTAVIERNVTFEGEFTTEPYETAWASEARWFLHVLDATPGAVVDAQVQVSPEGLTWCDHECPPRRHEGSGLFTVPLREVGPWLRLKGVVSGPEARIKAIVYLTLRG